MEQLVESLGDSLIHDLDIDVYALILFTRTPEALPTRQENPDIADSVLGHSLMGSRGRQPSGQQVVCGRFGEKEQLFLFSDSAQDVGSAALSPLNVSTSVGVLALGSRDKNRFYPGSESVLIGHIAGAVSRTLGRLILM